MGKKTAVILFLNENGDPCFGNPVLCPWTAESRQHIVEWVAAFERAIKEGRTVEFRVPKGE